MSQIAEIRRRTFIKKGRKNLVSADEILIGVECEFTRPDVEEHETNGTLCLLLQKSIETYIASNLDASQRDGGGVEVRTEPYNFEWWAENGMRLFTHITKVATGLNFTGDNKRAGIHIHIDRSIFTVDQFLLFVDFIADNQDFMLTMSRRGKRSSFINPKTKEGKNHHTFHGLRGGDLKEQYQSPAYYNGNQCIVLNSHGKTGTIECRFFNGSTDPAVIMSCIEFIRAICYFIKSKRDKTLTCFEEYLTDYKSKYPYLVKYLNSKKLVNITED